MILLYSMSGLHCEKYPSEIEELIFENDSALSMKSWCFEYHLSHYVLHSLAVLFLSPLWMRQLNHIWTKKEP